MHNRVRLSSLASAAGFHSLFLHSPALNMPWTSSIPFNADPAIRSRWTMSLRHQTRTRCESRTHVHAPAPRNPVLLYALQGAWHSAYGLAANHSSRPSRLVEHLGSLPSVSSRSACSCGRMHLRSLCMQAGFDSSVDSCYFTMLRPSLYNVIHVDANLQAV
jgi:hypothetical protein